MAVCVHILGKAPVSLWKLSSHERYRRVLRQAGITAMTDDLSSVQPGDSVLIVRGDYLFDGQVLHDLAKSLNRSGFIKPLLEVACALDGQILTSEPPRVLIVTYGGEVDFVRV